MLTIKGNFDILFAMIHDQEEITGTVRRMLDNADRFDNYREVWARFPSIGKCGHQIKKGDKIGWNKRHGVYCSACWAQWKAENDAADHDERFMSGNGFSDQY